MSKRPDRVCKLILGFQRRGAVICRHAFALAGVFVIRVRLATGSFVGERVSAVIRDQTDLVRLRHNAERLKRPGHHPRLDGQVVAHRLLKLGVHVVLPEIAR